MSAPDLSTDEILAAEYVLGLLEGESLLQARGRVTSDPGFSAAVQWWEARLAPLLDELNCAEPDPELWMRIERHLAEDPSSGSGEVVELRRRLRYWKSTATMALAASVAALVFALLPLLRAPTAPAVTQSATIPGAPLVASIPIADTPLRLAVTFIPERRELLVSASGVPSDGVHDHELWLVPPEGDPQSLGVVEAGTERSVSIDQALARLVKPGTTLALSREPLGGKPAGREVGPIVGLSTLTEI